VFVPDAVPLDVLASGIGADTDPAPARDMAVGLDGGDVCPDPPDERREDLLLTVKARDRESGRPFAAGEGRPARAFPTLTRSCQLTRRRQLRRTCAL
jgi:hypothetical protein